MNGRLRIGACLSLSGRFAQFGRQAAQGLETWCSLHGAAEILVEDDCSDRRTLEMVPPDLCIVHGPGSFGRQVADGAEAVARRVGIRTVRVAADDQVPPPGISAEWDLFSAGVFEQDAELVSKVLRSPAAPRRVCAVAAGVREFGRVVDDPDGVFGIAQWFPGSGRDVALGPPEDEFLGAYAARAGSVPDYPAVQVAAGAVIATRCARLAGGTSRDALWAAAADLETSTLFGGFRIDPENGAQVKHQTVLVQWADGEPRPVDQSEPAAA